jgi:hypothetical protein
MSTTRFRVAYAREIEPMTDRTQWPHVELHLLLVHLLLKERSEDEGKLKGFMEGGHKKKGAKDGDSTTEGGGTNIGTNTIAPINAKGQKMKRGPMTCLKCGKQVAGKLVPSADSI